MTYAANRLYEEVAYVAYYFHWSLEEILELEHPVRRSLHRGDRPDKSVSFGRVVGDGNPEPAFRPVFAGHALPNGGKPCSFSVVSSGRR